MATVVRTCRDSPPLLGMRKTSRVGRLEKYASSSPAGEYQRCPCDSSRRGLRARCGKGWEVVPVNGDKPPDFGLR